MNSYTIQKVADRPNWNAIEVLSMDNRYDDTPVEMHAFAQIAYSDDSLLVHLWSENDDVRAEEYGLLGSPCNDSCLEFFFSPVNGDERYFNIEFNVNGCMYLGLASSIENLVRLLPNEECAQVFAPTIRRADTGWEIFYTVPFAFVRRFFPDFAAKQGGAIRANCYKCADLTTPPNYLSWNPIEGETLSFHRPACFGVMYFG